MPDPTDEARPELREQAIAHIEWLRRSSGAPSGWTADNRQSADLLERCVAALDALAARVVADRPDQPTPGTVLFEGTITELDHWIVNQNDGGTRVTVHAADPHTGHNHE